MYKERILEIIDKYVQEHLKLAEKEEEFIEDNPLTEGLKSRHTHTLFQKSYLQSAIALNEQLGRDLIESNRQNAKALEDLNIITSLLEPLIAHQKGFRQLSEEEVKEMKKRAEELVKEIEQRE